MVPPAKEMLSSLLRPRQRQPVRHVDSNLLDSHPNSPSPGPADRGYSERRHATADFTEADDDEEEDEDEDEFDIEQQALPRFTRFRDQGDIHRSPAVMPLFSASYLDALPVYNLVHAIRVIVQARTETSLTWDQLRSPQVSQFLIKPMQQQIRTQHFNRATLYALVANCLQFTKEGQLYPGNAGVSLTRAKVCELLALKLLKEYSTRELIDALSYEFYPLQGAPDTLSTPATRTPDSKSRTTAARSSTLEVAIRATAKHFLAHPLVVQHLEGIWNGVISFYSSHDSLHRIATPVLHITGPQDRDQNDVRTPLLGHQSTKENQPQLPLHAIPVRRTVDLYDPRNASPLKLSRLRVPRYRQFLSTGCLFVLICLFLAVLIQRSGRITSLELIFWFWSAGFMLDEVVGFNEQGFSLYIMSFWNIFDLGILLVLVVYYFMRIYGVFLIDPHRWNDLAYDVLAANAILLVPRIFSVLDHYQYFSQLLIAFRLMAIDLVAVFVLVLISCSGFFVFFTLSKNNNDAADVAYKIFQILMGFSPAAWDVWPEYNFLGRLLLVAFLIICHFLVVTILITVLTNSFMAIASNAREEHQFLFAINTISMVKNDALFSYVAPANIFAWTLMPLRYVLPMRRFVVLNRTVIKLTHFPILFCIFLYEKYLLASAVYEPTDLIDHHGHGRHREISLADPASRGVLFSPNIRTREESVAGFQKDRALDEVFRRPPDATIRSQRRHERKKTQTAIRNWMDQSDEVGERLTQWPTIDSRPSISHRRMSMTRDYPRRLRQVSDVRSAASDPADLVYYGGFTAANTNELDGRIVQQQTQFKDTSDADGDDELVTNDEDDDDEAAPESHRGTTTREREEGEDYFNTPMATRFGTLAPASVSSPPQRYPISASPRNTAAPRRQGLHSRTLSTNTILYNPQEAMRLGTSPSVAPEEIPGARSRPRTSRLVTTVEQSAPTGTRSPRRLQHAPAPSRPKPIPMKSAPTRMALLTTDPRRRRAPSIDVDMNSDIGLPDVNDLGAVPSSFATQMAMATGQLRGLEHSRQDHENANRMSRLVLARMKTLEEGFADVVKEMRVLRSAAPTAQNSGDDGSLRGIPSDVSAAGGMLKRQQPKSKGDHSLSGSVEARTPMATAMSPRKRRAKGKGKAVARSEENENESVWESRRLQRRGSSF